MIPTVSARAIETVGEEKASLVSGITFMCQLAGSALLLAVNTAVFAAVGTGRIRQILDAQGVELAPAQFAAATDFMVGSQNIHHFTPGGLDVSSVGHLAEVVTQAYLDGLQVVLWSSGALVAVAFLLVLKFVPGRPAATLVPAVP